MTQTNKLLWVYSDDVDDDDDAFVNRTNECGYPYELEWGLSDGCS